MGSAASIEVEEAEQLTPRSRADLIDSILSEDQGADICVHQEFLDHCERLKQADLSPEEVQEGISKLLAIRQGLLESKKTAPPPAKSKTEGDSVPVATTLPKLSSPKSSSRTYLVCVDGSNTADNAFHSVMNLLRSDDNIVVYHTYQPFSEAALKPIYRSKDIREKYETLLSQQLPKDRYHVLFHERKEDETAKDAVIRMVEVLHEGGQFAQQCMFGPHLPDFLVFGFYGRNSELESRQFMGSKIDLALRSVQLPIFICKTVCKPKRRTFIFCVDSSSVSRKGLRIFANMHILQAEDTLRVVHFVAAEQLKVEEVADHSNKSPKDSSEVQTFYERELADWAGVQSQYVEATLNPELSVAENILAYVNEGTLDSDFLVLAPRSQETVSSVTEEALWKVKCSVLLCKAMVD